MFFVINRIDFHARENRKEAEHEDENDQVFLEEAASNRILKKKEYMLVQIRNLTLDYSNIFCFLKKLTNQ